MFKKLLLALTVVAVACPVLAGPEADILEDLAHDEMLAAMDREADAETRLHHWTRALELTEQAFEASDELLEQVLILGHLAERAFLSEQYTKASVYADRALREFRGLDDRPFARRTAAGAYHSAHLVLGKLALLDDDVVVAIEHLHAAARLDPDPSLKTFGPNMALALELLELGEREAVVQYFELCRDFWRSGVEQGTLDRWSAVVAQGGIPDFRGNLVYGQ